jgi:hypothetical protein
VLRSKNSRKILRDSTLLIALLVERATACRRTCSASAVPRSRETIIWRKRARKRERESEKDKQIHHVAAAVQQHQEPLLFAALSTAAGNNGDKNSAQTEHVHNGSRSHSHQQPVAAALAETTTTAAAAATTVAAAGTDHHRCTAPVGGSTRICQSSCEYRKRIASSSSGARVFRSFINAQQQHSSPPPRRGGCSSTPKGWREKICSEMYVFKHIRSHCLLSNGSRLSSLPVFHVRNAQ